MLPKDPLLLMSVVNTKLRDRYPDLDSLCEDLDVSRDALTRTLDGIGYAYSPAHNQFVRK